MEHKGPNVYSGHWFAYLKQPNDKQWYLQDDQKPTSIKFAEEKLLKKQPMHLFYVQRKGTHSF